MELNEEKQLAEIVEGFSAVVQTFAKRDFEKAEKGFDEIIEKYKDSEYYSVLEIQARAKVYKNICMAQLNPATIDLVDDRDHVNEGLYQLNAGNYDKALEVLSPLENKGFDDAYVDFLLSLVYFKKEDVEASLNSLKKAVEKDSFYKIIAHNDPDFDDLFDNEAFMAIINMEK
jgi:tetratricopeptide (TPR) repeat protein